MNWRVVGAVVLAALIVVGVQSFRVHRLKADLQDAKAETLQAQIQATLSDKVRVIEDRRHTIETIITEKADDAADQIGADSRGAAPIDPGLLADWRRALVGVREAGVRTSDPDPGQPAGELPPT